MQADFVSKDYDYIGVNNGHDAKLIKTIKSGVSCFSLQLLFHNSESEHYMNRFDVALTAFDIWGG